VTTPAGAGGLAGGASWPGPWVADTALSPEERREFEERRAAIEARADRLARERGACGDLRARVRDSLLEVRQVRSVEVGWILLTAHPPKMPVTFAVRLGSGRVVWDRLVVTVPVSPRVVPLGGSAPDAAAVPCDPGAP
jgi:hypothetical protein